MFNMRIDIVRKEMERRFREIEEAQDNSGVTEKQAPEFIYFLLTNEITKPFIIDLARYFDKFKMTERYNQIKSVITSSIINLYHLMENAKIVVDGKFDQKFQDHFKSFRNLFNYIDLPKIQERPLSSERFLDGLREIEKHFDRLICDASNLSGIFGNLNSIFQNAKDWNYTYDISKYKAEYDKLDKCIGEMKAYLRTKYQYEGAEATIYLLSIFFKSQYTYLVDLKPEEFGERVANESEESTLWRERNDPNTRKYTKQLYHAVDNYLSTSKSKNALIERLITYCTWIKRDSIKELKGKQKEQKISQIVEEFIFNYGYFPLVNFKMGKSIPDILSVGGIGWQDSVLIELKQCIGKKYPDAQLPKDIGQAQAYLTQVKGVNPDVADVVYLLVFYDGDEGLIYNESDNSPKDVIVEFIYVGDKSPSKLKYRPLTI